MMIYLMRHGEALTPDIDIKRPLSEVGKRSTAKISQYLEAISVNIEAIYHSGVLRAAQTAQIIAERVAPHIDLQVMSHLGSPEGASIIAEEIKYISHDILLVGHIPLLPRLLSTFVIQNETRWISYFQYPDTIVCLENIEGNWSIKWIIYPALLPQ